MVYNAVVREALGKSKLGQLSAGALSQRLFSQDSG